MIKINNSLMIRGYKIVTPNKEYNGFSHLFIESLRLCP